MCIGHRGINSFVYADDIVLLAISLHDMLIASASTHNAEFLKNVLVLITYSHKSNFMRVGPRYNSKIMCSYLSQ